MTHDSPWRQLCETLPAIVKEAPSRLLGAMSKARVQIPRPEEFRPGTADVYEVACGDLKQISNKAKGKAQGHAKRKVEGPTAEASLRTSRLHRNYMG